MANNPITPLTANMPTNWTRGQIVAPNGSDVGLATEYGYNYLMKQLNAAITAINTIGAAFPGLDAYYIPTSQKGASGGVASLTVSGVLESSQIPNIDCGIWDTIPVAQHNATAVTHQVMMADGNNTSVMDSSTTLEEHIANPAAHQNLVIDGNNT